MEQVEDPKLRLEARAQVVLLEEAARALGDDLFGFHVARDFDLRQIGLIYYIMASSDRLVDAVTTAQRYSRIANEGVRVHVQHNKTLSIAIEYVDPEPANDRQHSEFWLVAILRICRQLTATRIAPEHLRFRHHRKGEAADLATFVGCEIEYAAASNEVILPRSSASLPLQGSDPHLNKLLREYADEALARRSERSGEVRSRVERLMAQSLPHGKASAPEIARQLGVSQRTLARSLAEAGLSFSHILEALRTDLAKSHLAESDLSISQIAWLLGYKEVSSFTNAFRRWTGMTPRQLRAQSRLDD
jgi:AraC-like DNA-binding protein